MAYTVTREYVTFGNKRAVNMKITADNATQTVETGLSVVDGFSVGYASCATGPNFVYPNSNASGVESFGVLGMSGFTSGDVLFVLVYGR
jgi:hypothetical protein